MNVEVAVCSLLGELSPEWDKQPLGDQMTINVVNLLDCVNVCRCEFYFDIF